MNIQQTLKRQIRETMARKGITQVTLASDVGVTVPAINRVLTRDDLTLKNLQRIAPALGLKVIVALEEK